MPWTEDQNQPLSPRELAVILHYRGHADEYEAPGDWSDVASAAVNRGIMMRIEQEGRHTRTYQLTDRGEKWIDMILATPMPVNRWIDPRAEVAEGR